MIDVDKAGFVKDWDWTCEDELIKRSGDPSTTCVGLQTSDKAKGICMKPLNGSTHEDFLPHISGKMPASMTRGRLVLPTGTELDQAI